MKNSKCLIRRGLALALSLVMCVGMLQLPAFAAEEAQEAEITVLSDEPEQEPAEETTEKQEPADTITEDSSETAEKPSETPEEASVTSEEPSETPEDKTPVEEDSDKKANLCTDGNHQIENGKCLWCSYTEDTTVPPEDKTPDETPQMSQVWR